MVKMRAKQCKERGEEGTCRHGGSAESGSGARSGGVVRDTEEYRGILSVRDTRCGGRRWYVCGWRSSIWPLLLPVERGCRLRLAVGKRGELFQLARGNVRRGVRGGAGEREMQRRARAAVGEASFAGTKRAGTCERFQSSPLPPLLRSGASRRAKACSRNAHGSTRRHTRKFKTAAAAATGAGAVRDRDATNLQCVPKD